MTRVLGLHCTALPRLGGGSRVTPAGWSGPHRVLSGTLGLSQQWAPVWTWEGGVPQPLCVAVPGFLRWPRCLCGLAGFGPQLLPELIDRRWRRCWSPGPGPQGRRSVLHRPRSGRCVSRVQRLRADCWKKRWARRDLLVPCHGTVSPSRCWRVSDFICAVLWRRLLWLHFMRGPLLPLGSLLSPCVLWGLALPRGHAGPVHPPWPSSPELMMWAVCGQELPWPGHVQTSLPGCCLPRGDSVCLHGTAVCPSVCLPVSRCSMSRGWTELSTRSLPPWPWLLRRLQWCR